MVLPAGSAVPPLPHLLVLLVGAAAVGGLLRRERPAITGGVVLALAPWMVVGAALHVLHQVGGAPRSVISFLGTPAVYLTTAVVAGATWLLARRLSTVPEWRLGVVGSGLAVAGVGYTLVASGVTRLAVPVGGLLVGLALGFLAWRVLLWRRPADAGASGFVGLLVLVAHAVDGVSTAVGVDVLGFGERSPVSRAVMDVAGALPVAEVIGVGWLFVLLKLVVAGTIVVYFAPFLREEPNRANALLGLVAGVGLGPGAHNLLLFAVAVG